MRELIKFNVGTILTVITLVASACAADKGPKLSATYAGQTGKVSSNITMRSVDHKAARTSGQDLSVPTRPITTGSAFMLGFASRLAPVPTTGTTGRVVTYTPEKMYDWRGRYTYTVMVSSGPATRQTKGK